jgi:ketosteroid isomerase-like protein
MLPQRHERRPLCFAAIAGFAGAIAARALFIRALEFRFHRVTRALNAGDFGPLLSNYAEDALLRFNDREHRWAGEHRGRPAIARFLENFVAAGLKGEIAELFMAGPPWRLTLLVRFDDHAHGPAGEELYRNRTVLLVRMRWGRIVLHEDFYEDTQRILELESSLTALGIGRVQ